MSQVAHQAGAYRGFCRMKRLRVFLFPAPLDKMLVHRKFTPTIKVRRYPFTHLGGERHYERKVSCSRTQHNIPGQGSNPNRSIRKRAH